jgi:hypothetical protein
MYQVAHILGHSELEMQRLVLQAQIIKATWWHWHRDHRPDGDRCRRSCPDGAPIVAHHRAKLRRKL